MSRKSDMARTIGRRWSEEHEQYIPIFSNAEKTRLMQKFARRRDVLEYRYRPRLSNSKRAQRKRFNATEPRRVIPHLVGNSPYTFRQKLVWIG